MNDNDMMRIMAQAEKTNLKRDADEQKFCFASPTKCNDAELMRTAICAIEAGLKTKDWNCIAEAADMLAKRTGYYPWLKQTTGVQ
jgi:hypothetical protein